MSATDEKDENREREKKISSSAAKVFVNSASRLKVMCSILFCISYTAIFS